MLLTLGQPRSEDRELILSYSLESSLETERHAEGDEVETEVSANSSCSGSPETGAQGHATHEDDSVDGIRSAATSPSLAASASAPGGPLGYPPLRTRSLPWVASLRSRLLQRQRSRSLSVHGTPRVTDRRLGTDGSSPASNCNRAGPPDEAEMDRFLAEAWSKDAAEVPSSRYARKLAELKSVYERKTAEIDQREATYLCEYHDETTPLLTADKFSMHTDAALKKVLLKAQVHRHFNELRFKIKQHVAHSILALRGEQVDSGHRRRRKLSTKISAQQLEGHLDSPYPLSEQEMVVLASQCDVTVEQVSNWFGKKLTRSKSLAFAQDWRRKSATL